MTTTIEEHLKSVNLDKYFSNFVEQSITDEKFVRMTMADYVSVGITTLKDRKCLFQLLQELRASKRNQIMSIKAPPPAQDENEGDNGSTPPQLSPKANVRSVATLEPSQRCSVQEEVKQEAPFDDKVEEPQQISSPMPSPEQALEEEISHVVVEEDNSDVSETAPEDDTLAFPAPEQTNAIGFDLGDASNALGGGAATNNDMLSMMDAIDTKLSNTPPRSAPAAASLATQAQQATATQRQKIRVCVRKRPLNSSERSRADRDIVRVVSLGALVIDEPKVKLDLTPYIDEHFYAFDEVFDEHTNNVEVYARTAQPLVNSIFLKAKATCFAYGQTGSGKTHTMLGTQADGLYILAARDIFARLADYPKLRAYIGFFEIYGGKLFDLLNNRSKLHARDNGQGEVCIRGLREFPCTNVKELLNVIARGSQSRTVGTTAANADSSRSHAVLQIVLKTTGKKPQVHGKFSFIDLAGSERGSETGERDKQTRLEGAEINKSLLALKECIRALDLDSRHCPFRQSTLTQVLKDSFVGNARTCMIACVSPSSANCEHTLNTLRYTDRVKELGRDPNQQQQQQQGDSDSNTQGTHYREAVWPPPSKALLGNSTTSNNGSKPSTPLTRRRAAASNNASSGAVTAAMPPARNNAVRRMASSGHVVRNNSKCNVSQTALQRRRATGGGVGLHQNKSKAPTKSGRAMSTGNARKPRVSNATKRTAPKASTAPKVAVVDEGEPDYTPELITDITNIVGLHRRQIGEFMTLLQQEVELLDTAIDSSSTPQIETYIEHLDAIVEIKAAACAQLKDMMDGFKRSHMEPSTDA